MDTKWKNSFVGILVIILLLFGISNVFSSLDRGVYYFSKDYFHTNEFSNEVSEFVRDLEKYKFYEVNLEEAKKNIEVTQEEIEEHRNRYGTLTEQITNIKEQYESKIQEAKDLNEKGIEAAYKKERDAKIEDIKANFESEEHVEKKIRKEKETGLEKQYKEYLNEKKSFLDKEKSFVYFLRDTSTGETFTNISTDSQFSKKDTVYLKEYSAEKDELLHSSQNAVNYADDYYYDENGNAIYTNIMSDTSDKSYNFEGYIGVPNDLALSNQFMLNQKNFEKEKKAYIVTFILALISLLASLVLLKRVKKSFTFDNSFLIEVYSKISIDARMLIGIVSIFIGFGVIESFTFQLLGVYGSPENIGYLIRRAFDTLFWVIFIYLQAVSFYPYFTKQKNWENEWKKCISYRFVQSFKESFYDRKTGTRAVLSLLFISGFGALFVVSLFVPVLLIITIPGMFFVVLPVLIIFLRKIKYFGMITDATGKLIEGRMNTPLPEKGKDELRQMAENLNVLRETFTHSQKAQVKSERLKTELITNVSHDLRTPLTSIITYTDLLKTEGLTEDERNSYVEIIDRKSKRLKVLIDDLFEASKMASGNMELTKERVDIVQLMQQAVAEQGESFEKHNLQLRIAHRDTPVYAVVDGKRMWRVFDNILSNAIKYSLVGTRIYLNIEDNENTVEITCKNVSSHELGNDVDELLERFKRGDTSRNTEGSGLGLAIAKSIVDLHDGELQLEVDGDLFKVKIILFK